MNVVERRSASLAFLVLLATGAALADPTADDKAQAEALFLDGKRLMGQKKYDEACKKLAESQKLDPAGGTLLNLAICHELEGKTATAWVELKDALAQAQQDKKGERVKIAKEHLAQVEPKLARLNVIVPKESVVPGLTITRNGSAILDGSWGTPIPVDPGMHTVVVTAPGKKPWQNRIRVAEAETRELTVPALDPDPSLAPSASAAPIAVPPDDHGGRKTSAYVLGGAGIVALGVGAFFGVRTLSKKSESDTHCPTKTTCDAAGVSANDAAHTSAWVSDVGFGVGAAAIAVSAYLLFGGSSESHEAASLRVAPWMGKNAIAASLGGSF